METLGIVTTQRIPASFQTRSICCLGTHLLRNRCTTYIRRDIEYRAGIRHDPWVQSRQNHIFSQIDLLGEGVVLRANPLTDQFIYTQHIFQSSSARIYAAVTRWSWQTSVPTSNLVSHTSLNAIRYRKTYVVPIGLFSGPTKSKLQKYA